MSVDNPPPRSIWFTWGDINPFRNKNGIGVRKIYNYEWYADNKHGINHVRVAIDISAGRINSRDKPRRGSKPDIIDIRKEVSPPQRFREASSFVKTS